MEGKGCHIYLVNYLWEIVTIDQEIVKSQRKTQSIIVLKKIQIPKGFNGNLMKMNTVDVTLNQRIFLKNGSSKYFLSLFIILSYLFFSALIRFSFLFLSFSSCFCFFFQSFSEIQISQLGI